MTEFWIRVGSMQWAAVNTVVASIIVAPQRSPVSRSKIAAAPGFPFAGVEKPPTMRR